MATSQGKKKPLPKIQIDTREQQPYGFRASANCAGIVHKKLDFGDYAIHGHPEIISIERKNGIDELCNNLGKRRKQFVAELERMQAAKFKYVIIEDYWSSINRQKRSRISPGAIMGSIISFELKYGVHFIFAGNRKTAQQITRQLLIKAYKYTELEDDS